MGKNKNNNEIEGRAYFSALNTHSKMSVPERLFNDTGYILLKDTVSAEIDIEVVLYEWMTFNLPGGKYTPDFFVLFSDGSMAFVEVKQESFSRSGRAFRGQSYRDSRSKLRAAAELNPWFRFYMAVYNSRAGWNLESIDPDRGLEWLQRKGWR